MNVGIGDIESGERGPSFEEPSSFLNETLWAAQPITDPRHRSAVGLPDRHWPAIRAGLIDLQAGNPCDPCSSPFAMQIGPPVIVFFWGFLRKGDFGSFDTAAMRLTSYRVVPRQQ